MRILNLKISNFKKLVNVEITPRDNVIKISGKNGAGKTSVLDAFWCALGGTKVAPAKPVREGAKSATIKIDLGDITVERRFSANGKSVLFVTNEIGTKVKAPQDVLNNLLGKLSFDPLQFMRLGAKEQVTYLKDIVGLDFSAIDSDREIAYDKRTQAKRTLSDLESQHEAINVHEDTPDEQINVSDLVDDLREAHETNVKLGKVVSRETEINKSILSIDQQINELNNQILSLNTERDDLQTFVGNNAIIDTSKIEQRMQDIELLNGYFRDKQTRDVLAERIAKGQTIIECLGAEISGIDQDKREQLASAKFPLPGLGFDNDDVMFKNLPISQASFAEQLKISTSMAMALSPDLRVIRITDGSMLDTESMAVIENIAEKNDFQVWVEIVDESGDVGVFIKDGEVANNKKESAA